MAPRSYYVSFDNEQVGKLQGQTLVDCLNTKGVTNPQIIEMDGGKDVDNNAILFAKGADSVLDATAGPGQAQGRVEDHGARAGTRTWPRRPSRRR